MKTAATALMSSLAALMLGCLLWSLAAADARRGSALDDDALSSTICPIVYPLDESPTNRGFHYLFYGNGFFINDQGYLLTAAHVLNQLTDAQPYIVLRLAEAPPRLFRAAVVAVDQEHDVAILRAIPNPFEGKYQVRYLPLAVDWPASKKAVLAAALRPSRLKDPYTFDAFVEDRPAGEILKYEFSELEKGRADTELLLFSHGVLLGDSGAPVVSAESKTVLGLVEGRWLRADAAALASATTQSASGVGAAVPIHYAIPLLQQNGVAWHEAAHQPEHVRSDSGSTVETDSPVALSLVAAPYPAQGLEGGEVVLDSAIGQNGQISDTKVVSGAAPFLDVTLNAIRTWTFRPAQMDEPGEHSRIGIIFQFAHPGALNGKNSVRWHDPRHEDAPDRPAMPIVTKEPDISAASNDEASVILSVNIDGQGTVAAIDVLQDPQFLAPAISESVRQWQFAPGRRAGADCASKIILVVIPRHHASGIRADPTKRSSETELHTIN